MAQVPVPFIEGEWIGRKGARHDRSVCLIANLFDRCDIKKHQLSKQSALDKVDICHGGKPGKTTHANMIREKGSHWTQD